MSEQKPIAQSFTVIPNGLLAFSTQEGITVSSTCFNDIQKISATTYYNEKGDIETKIFTQSIEMTHKKYFSENLEYSKFVESRNLLITFIYILFIGLLSLFGNIRLTIYSLVFFAFSLITDAYKYIPDYFVNILFAKKYKSFSRFHSAEHMGAKAAFKLKRAPTLEEIKQESRYDPKCSTVVTIALMFKSVLDSLILTFYSINIVKLLLYIYPSTSSVFIKLLTAFGIIFSFYFIRFILSVLNDFIISILKDEKYLKFFQAPFLAKPTEYELEIAVEAFRIQKVIDDEIEQNTDDFTIKSFNFDIGEKEVVFELKNGEICRTTFNEYEEYISTLKTLKIVTQE